MKVVMVKRGGSGGDEEVEVELEVVKWLRW